MKIECSNCEMYQSHHCEDCLVTALLSPSSDSVELEEDLDPSIEALTAGGLIPVLKFRPRTDTDPPGKEKLSDTA